MRVCWNKSADSQFTKNITLSELADFNDAISSMEGPAIKLSLSIVKSLTPLFRTSYRDTNNFTT